MPPLRGGIAHHSASLAAALQRLGHDVKAMSYLRQYPRLLFPGQQETDAGQADPGVPVRHTLTALNPLRWARAATLLARARPDVVVVAWWNASLLGPIASLLAAAQARGVPAVLLAHNVRSHEGGRASLDDVAWRVLSRLATGVVVHGSKSADALRALQPALMVSAHDHPPYERFLRFARSRADARASLHIPTETQLALVLGNVRPYKGVDVAVRAVGRLAATFPRLRLVVAGEVYASARAALDEALAEAAPGQVRVLDRYLPDDEVARWVCAADVLLASHRQASHSGVVQVARALGLPIIASRVGGLPELVDERGGDRLVEPEDPTALARGIQAFFASPPSPPPPPSSDEMRRAWESLAGAVLDLARPSARLCWKA